MGAWVVESVAAALGRRLDPVALVDGLTGEGLDALSRAAQEAGLAVVRFQSPEEALRLARTVPVAAQAPGGAVWLLEPAAAGRVRVRTGAEEERVMAEAEVLEALGSSPQFAVFELAFAFDPHGAHAHDHPSAWVRLGRLARMERADLVVVGVYAVAIGALTLVVPVAVQTLVNTVVFGTLLQPLFWLSLLAFAGLAGSAVLQLAQLRVVEVLQQRVFVRLVAELAHRLPRLERDGLDIAPTVLVNRFFDVLTVQKALATLLLDGVAVLVSGTAGTLLLALYSPWFLFYAGALWAALLALLVVTGRNGPDTSIAESKAKHEVADWLEQVAGSPLAFRDPAAARWASVRADALSRRYLGAREAHFRIWSRQVGGLLLLSAVASTSLLGLGGWLVVTGSLTVGQLLAAELVVGAVLGSFAKLGKQLESLYDLLAALDKIGHLLDVPLERAGGAPLPTAEGPLALELRGLAFGWADARPLFEGIDLTVRPGERIALVGPAGSGRSALLDLLHGERAPTGGAILVDGVDLREVDLGALRARVTLTRGAEVVAGTAADNVRAGRSGASAAEVRRALAEVGLLDELVGLPGGPAAPLGPDGRPLGGSQLRRLGLARALLGRPGLLLVDEGLFEGLSARKRRVLLDTLLGADRSRTVILATRDPDVAARCDRRLVFEGGAAGAPMVVRTEGGGSWVA